MDAILEQLGLNETFFIQFVIFAALYAVLSRVYFAPFLKLFEYRNRRTVEDKAAAGKLFADADLKLEEYKKRLTQERTEARKHLDHVLLEAKKDEALILNSARNEAKLLTQEAVDSVSKQREELKKQLQSEVERLAQGVCELLMAKK